MRRRQYRICLIVILVLVIVGGIFYWSSLKGNKNLADGTFVKKTMECYETVWV
ncbi:MAG: hypothetical protein RR364_06090 [Lachnospiraceae bacterium]